MSKKPAKVERPKCGTCGGGGFVFGASDWTTAVGLPGLKKCGTCNGTGRA